MIVDERYDIEKRNNLSITGKVTNVTGKQEARAGAAVWSWVMDEYGAARAKFEWRLLGGK